MHRLAIERLEKEHLATRIRRGPLDSTDALDDPAYRRMFVEDVAENREALELAAYWFDHAKPS